MIEDKANVNINRKVNLVEDNQTCSSQQSSKRMSAREIMKKINSQLQINKQKYHEVICEKSDFAYHPFQPIFNTHQNIDVLTLQFDKLLEEECKLDQQLNKINFYNEADEYKKMKQTSKNMNHYSFLRKVWTDSTSENGNANVLEKINTLTHKVGFIKGHIRQMCKMEEQNSQPVSELITSSKEYRDLCEKLEKREVQHAKQKQNLEGEIDELKQIIDIIKEQNSAIKTNMKKKQAEEKYKSSEILKLKEKIQNIQIDLMHKERQIKRSAKQGNETKQFIVTSLDSSFSLIIKSKLINCQKNCVTTKNLPQLYDFILSREEHKIDKIDKIDELIENGKNTLFDKIVKKDSMNEKKYEPLMHSRGKFKNKQESDRSSQVFLGSQQKKRRFERSRMMQLE